MAALLESHIAVICHAVITVYDEALCDQEPCEVEPDKFSRPRNENFLQAIFPSV